MGLVDRSQLLARLSPPLDPVLTTQLVDEFISMERRFIQRDWEPAELDGGQFCEVLARILYHIDSGNLNRGKEFGACLDYVEEDRNAHAISPRHDALHLAKVLRTIYKFRSQRGAVHISPNYTPNHMDSKFLIEAVRWCMNETLRIFWNADREQVAKAIRELLQFDVPAIGVFKDVIVVQRTDLSAEEEVLVLLHYAGEVGFSRRELGIYCGKAPASVTRTVQKLTAPECRQVVEVGGRFRLTDLGERRLREQLADKLLVQ
jgi:hypothetical protein